MDLDGPVRPLAKAEGWRDDLAQDLGDPFALVELAYDQQSAAQAEADNVPGCLQPADSDAGPYRTLLAVGRGRLPDAADLPTTDVADEPDGRVSAYPDGGGAAED